MRRIIWKLSAKRTRLIYDKHVDVECISNETFVNLKRTKKPRRVTFEILLFKVFILISNISLLSFNDVNLHFLAINT